MTNKSDTKLFTGWHALAWLIGLFSLMFAVNGIFLYHAITSYPGEDMPKSYVQGLNYNTVLSERKSQSELQWTAQLGIDRQELVLRIIDKDGNPIGGRKVEVLMRRPATTASDTTILMQPNDNSEYRTNVGGLENGEWEAVVSIYAIEGNMVDFIALKKLQLS